MLAKPDGAASSQLEAGPVFPSRLTLHSAQQVGILFGFLIGRCAQLSSRAVSSSDGRTLEAYRHDFDAIAALVVGDPDRIRALTPRSITKDTMRQAFAAYADSHAAASIRRCWSTWNTLCSYLFTADLLRANPMDVVGRPKPAKTLPRSLPPTAAHPG